MMKKKLSFLRRLSGKTKVIDKLKMPGSNKEKISYELRKNKGGHGNNLKVSNNDHFCSPSLYHLQLPRAFFTERQINCIP